MVLRIDPAGIDRPPGFQSQFVHTALLASEHGEETFARRIHLERRQQLDSGDARLERGQLFGRHLLERHFPIELPVTLSGQIFVNQFARVGGEPLIDRQEQPMPHHEEGDQQADCPRNGEQCRIPESDFELNGAENPLRAP